MYTHAKELLAEAKADRIKRIEENRQERLDRKFFIELTIYTLLGITLLVLAELNIDVIAKLITNDVEAQLAIIDNMFK